MEDRMTTTRPDGHHPESSRINVNEEHELRHWAHKFGVSQNELIRAIEAVGSHAKSVEVHLKLREEMA